MNRRVRSSGSGGSRAKLGLDNMAGWLFADLLLVLFIVGVGAEITQATLAEPPPPPKVQEPSEIEEPPGMEQDPVTRRITVDADSLLDSGSASAKAERKRIRGDLREGTQDLVGRRAAMVLVWGHSPDVGRGQELSNAVADQLAKARKGTFQGAAEKTLWKGDRNEGMVELEIYLFNE